MPEPMEPLLVLPPERLIHERQFEATPLTIVKIYLQCFDSEGHQAFQVPRYVLEALAKRFLLVMDGELSSLDRAFGGRVARQRNRLNALDSDWSVLWDLLAEIEKVKAESKAIRGKGSPFDIAVERVAQERGMGPDNIRRIYKRSAKQ